MDSKKALTKVQTIPNQHPERYWCLPGGSAGHAWPLCVPPTCSQHRHGPVAPVKHNCDKTLRLCFLLMNQESHMSCLATHLMSDAGSDDKRRLVGILEGRDNSKLNSTDTQMMVIKEEQPIPKTVPFQQHLFQRIFTSEVV